jgi:hypothetical protein
MGRRLDFKNLFLILWQGWNTGGAKSLFYNGQYLADAEGVIAVTIKLVLQLLA